jgi:hypothetical protein
VFPADFLAISAGKSAGNMQISSSDNKGMLRKTIINDNNNLTILKNTTKSNLKDLFQM